MPTSRIGQLLDELVAGYASGPHTDEAIRAREDWLERAGRVYDDEECYEARLSSFHEWYTLSRPLAGAARPVERHLAEHGPELAESDRECLRALCRAQWSLFEVLDRTPTVLRLFDLFYGGRFEVLAESELPGLERNDIFEARLIGLGGQVRFTRAFLFHPRETSAAVVAHLELARQRGEDRETVLFRLAQVRLRCDRYRNIAPRKVYEQTLLGRDRAAR
jgi:hypothetical protein